jgi:hypothetical protein
VDQTYRHYIARIGKPPGPMLDDYAARVSEGAVWVLEEGAVIAAIIVLLPAPKYLLLDKHRRFPHASGLRIANGAGTPVSVVARAGAPKPDISSVEAFKHALLTARSIVYADPAKGGASGVYFARVLDRLGIADQLKDKTILVPGAQAAEVKGDA